MSAQLDIGAMRHRITIEAPTDIPDGSGGFTRSWVPVVTLWAAVGATAAAEAIRDEAERETPSRTFTIRWRSDVSSTDRILFDDRPHNILSVTDPDGRHAVLNILAQEYSE